MKATCKIIWVLTCISVLTSCMTMDMEAPSCDMNDTPVQEYQGSVMDSEGTPIEHIKVTIDWQGAFPVKAVKYTDSKGIFYLELIQNAEYYTISLTLEDIDGEENGGTFETLTDTITLFDDYESGATVKLDYRLNRATASESSPQS